MGFEILAIDEAARTWSWRASLGLVSLVLDHCVTETESGSTTTLAITGPLPLVLGYMLLAQLALRQLVAAPQPDPTAQSQ